jgi:hypothetical protein
MGFSTADEFLKMAAPVMQGSRLVCLWFARAGSLLSALGPHLLFFGSTLM